jgi:hypothetical protein
MKKYARITMERIIRYQPKLSKLWRFTKSIRNRIATSDTKNATTMPMIKTIISFAVIDTPESINFKTLSPDAPSIIGIAIKKENSAEAMRETPESIPPIMVEPEREVPGISEST